MRAENRLHDIELLKAPKAVEDKLTVRSVLLSRLCALGLIYTVSCMSGEISLLIRTQH